MPGLLPEFIQRLNCLYIKFTGRSKTLELKTVILERVDDVAVIKLNRPKVLNAQNEQMILDLSSALREVYEDAATKALILKGEGRAFCSGYDISAGHLANGMVTERMQETTRLLLRIGKPTIAAIQGYCLGGGAEWAMNCDIRIATVDAKFGFPEVKVGSTITNAGTKLLPLMIGMGRAAELILTGRIIDAKTAEQWGLVNKVVALKKLDTEAMEMASVIKSGNGQAICMARLGLWYGVSSPVEQVLDFELLQARITYNNENSLITTRSIQKSNKPSKNNLR
jgi:enoyl-CoA hydratase